MPALSRILRVTRATVHSVCGRVAYRLGWLPTARRQYERVLLLRGADFHSYVQLGRIAFDLGDYAGWRREFEHARRTDPIRFARLRHPMELFEPRLAGTSFDRVPDSERFGADTRATWRQLRPFGAGARDDGRGHDGFGAGTDMPLAPGFDPMLPGQQLEHEDDDLLDPSRDGLDGRRNADDDERGDAAPTNGPSDAHAGSTPDASLTRDDFASASERRRFQLRRPIDRQEIARCDLDDLLRKLSS